MEIVLESVVSIALPASSGPNIQIFKRFKVVWTKLNKDSFQTAEDDPNIAARIAKFNDDLIAFVNKQQKEHQPRDDYKDLFELSIIFVGGIPTSGINFKKTRNLSLSSMDGKNNLLHEDLDVQTVHFDKIRK